MKKTLLYGMDDSTADEYQTIAANMDMEMYLIGDAAMNLSIDQLFELNDDLDNVHEEFPESYLLMQNVKVDELVSLLHAFAAAGKPYEGIKIMQTDVNHEWTLRHLLTEAGAENRVTKKAYVLQQLMKSCNSADLSSMEPKQAHEFKESLMSSYLLLQSGQYDEEHLDSAIHTLSESLKNCRKLMN